MDEPFFTITGRTQAIPVLGLALPDGVWIFHPQPDITAYELARLLPILVSPNSVDIATLDAELQRHFTRLQA
jgi:hypothetical protein